MEKNTLSDFNETRWQAKILAQDLSALDREHRHLLVKLNTVGLSSWEIARLGELDAERGDLKEELATVSGVFTLPME